MYPVWINFYCRNVYLIPGDSYKRIKLVFDFMIFLDPNIHLYTLNFSSLPFLFQLINYNKIKKVFSIFKEDFYKIKINLKNTKEVQKDRSIDTKRRSIT